uniref:Tc1-like transposase DDE domain-containing protein n=1 Tax=Pseudonaja textilis TaxID=8673 RepID=A0A670XN32_PSETE
YAFWLMIWSLLNAGGSLTAIRYQDEILRPLVRPYAGAVGPGFLLMHNNARPHVAGVCQQFLQDEGIDAMDWPARSPDLNPIEHIWDIMSRSIHQLCLVFNAQAKTYCCPLPCASLHYSSWKKIVNEYWIPLYI